MRQAFLAFREISAKYFLVYAFTSEEAQVIAERMLFEGFTNKPIKLIRDPDSDQFALQGKDVEMDKSKVDRAWYRVYRLLYPLDRPRF